MKLCLWAWRGTLPERRSARRGAAVSGCGGAGGRAADGHGGPGVFEGGSDEGGKGLAEQRNPVWKQR